MALYLLKRNEFDYDEYNAHLVRASSECEARKIAANYHEDPDEWLNVLKSSCKLISTDGANEVILSSFNAG